VGHNSFELRIFVKGFSDTWRFRHGFAVLETYLRTSETRRYSLGSEASCFPVLNFGSTNCLLTSLPCPAKQEASRGAIARKALKHLAAGAGRGIYCLSFLCGPAHCCISACAPAHLRIASASRSDDRSLIQARGQGFDLASQSCPPHCLRSTTDARRLESPRPSWGSQADSLRGRSRRPGYALAYRARNPPRHSCVKSTLLACRSALSRLRGRCLARDSEAQLRKNIYRLIDDLPPYHPDRQLSARPPANVALLV